MHCYVCAQMGKETVAIATCIVCGMALCQEHLIRADIDMWEGVIPSLARRPKKGFQESFARNVTMHLNEANI